MKASIQCQGCGAFLQSHDPNALGYIPRQALESRKGDLICQRCYRIKHYGKDQNTPVDLTPSRSSSRVELGARCRCDSGFDGL